MATFLFLLSLCLLLSSSSAMIICEDLPESICSFSISYEGKRCILESSPRENGGTQHQCTTSKVVTDKMSNWVEKDECVEACGLDRTNVGISSDTLLDPQFITKLCSPACLNNCPNIVDLYDNLSAGEGVNLPDLCNANRENPRRSMVELMSSGEAMGPASSMELNDISVASAPSV